MIPTSLIIINYTFTYQVVDVSRRKCDKRRPTTGRRFRHYFLVYMFFRFAKILFNHNTVKCYHYRVDFITAGVFFLLMQIFII